jgi:hypothetical protein
MERCLACEAEAVGARGALPRLRGRGKQAETIWTGLAFCCALSCKRSDIER